MLPINYFIIVGGEDAERFRNRKGYFSINVQTLSDAHMKIQNIVARWPGSVHDSTIFENSRLKAQMETMFRNSFILGDSGYAVENYLMTPLANPTTRAENLYNESLIRTRNVVERSYGIWKRRFPCLSMGIRTKIETTLKIIVATAILHNIAIDMNVENPVHDPNIAHVEWNNEVHNRRNDRNMTRRALIEEYFAGLNR